MLNGDLLFQASYFGRSGHASVLTLILCNDSSVQAAFAQEKIFAEGSRMDCMRHRMSDVSRDSVCVRRKGTGHSHGASFVRPPMWSKIYQNHGSSVAELHLSSSAVWVRGNRSKLDSANNSFGNEGK